MTEILKPKTAGNINDWANALEKKNPKLSESLGEDRNIGIENLEKFGLPRYKNNKLSLIDFLENPQSAIKNLGTTHFTVGVNPHDPKLARYNSFNITLDQTIAFIKEKISENQRENYDIIISQYFNNLYGGNIIIGENRKDLLVEFKEGSQVEIARGKTESGNILSARRDSYTGSFRYSFDDEKLRKLIYNSILKIPHEGEGRDMKFTPGYYEFVVVKEEKNSIPKTLFIDCKLNPAFNSLPKQ